MSAIKIEPTSDPAIIKFEADQFLTQHQSYEFGNIEEAAVSPLAQSLFHLPFVKTVYVAQNFVAVEKYNIVAWQDVQDEVANMISMYLDEGKNVIVEKKESNKKLPVTTYAESTPNPTVMKFVVNKKIAIKPTEFKSVEETQEGTLSRKLFNFPFIQQLFASENYISIMKSHEVEWNDVTLELREFIRESLENGEQIGKSTAVAAPQEQAVTVDEPNYDDLEGTPKQIVDILEEYVKPAVAGDGGNIVFQSYDEETKAVRVILQGACSGCPSATVTLKNGIETMLKDMLHGKVETVEAVNG